MMDSFWPNLTIRVGTGRLEVVMYWAGLKSWARQAKPIQAQAQAIKNREKTYYPYQTYNLN
jgi:hypothetical protein